MHWNPLIQEIQAKDNLISELQQTLAENQQRLEELSLALQTLLAAEGAHPTSLEQ
jgi:predicted RNase H-like nuclease (RuvC/YqgF family)